MEDLFGINAHRQAVQENIEKAFDLGFDADNNIEGIEKAKHQVGDIHPNGRWVWTEWAPGKFDWKSLKGKHHKGSQQTTTQQQITDDKEVASFMDKVKTFSNKYNDSSKISVSKTPKGNWDVSYDGHRLGIINADQLSEKAAKKQGWLKEENKKEDNIEVGKIYVGKFDGDTIEYEVKEKRGGGYQLISYTYGKDEDEHGNPKKYTDVQEVTKTLEDMVKKIKEEKYFDLNDTASNGGNKKEEDKKESKSVKLSAFLDKTLDAIKHYGNFDYDRIKNAEKVLEKNESFAKKFMSATFPAASESALFPAEKEISISDDESIILSAYKETDTTSRDPQYRGSTNYYYSVHYKVGNSKKLLSSDSYSRVFSSKYGGTSSERRQKCKIEALIRYFHI